MKNKKPSNILKQKTVPEKPEKPRRFQKTLGAEPEINSILSLSQIGLWKLDPERNLFSGSPVTFLLLGMKCPSGIIEFSDIKKMLARKNEKETLEKKIISLKSDNIYFDIELKIRKDHGEKKVLRMVAGKLEDGRLAGTITDITDAKKIERELIKSKNKAEKADLFKSIFLTNLSHELRTPMNAILGYTEILTQDTISPLQRKEYSNIVINKANYLLSIIDDIIELAKFENSKVAIRKTHFHIFPVFSELFGEYEKKRIERGKTSVSLQLVFHDELKDKEIFTDQGRLQQVMSILLNNAIDFTEKGSIEFGVRYSEGSYKFFVDDTGSGMTDTEQKQIFNRFSHIEETASGKYGGKGFSLTISRHIVELLGGKIKVKSEVNKGSRFQFILPDEKPEKPDQNMIIDIDDIKSINWKDKIILIAEDEEVNYKFLEAVLHKTQAQILRAKTGSEAIELCRKINQISIVLMDIKMPEMNGYEATVEIQKIRPKLPIIAQTAFSTQEEIIKCEESGCIDYITKPIDIRQLIKKIETYT